MDNLLALTKLLIRTEFLFNIPKINSKFKSIALKIFVFSALVWLELKVVKLYIKLFDSLEYNSEIISILSIGICGITIFMLIFGMFYTIYILYYSENNRYLVIFPIKPMNFISSKIIIVIIQSYLIEIVFLLPLFIAYSIKVGGGFYFWIYSLIVMLILPIIPAVISAIICIIIAKISPFKLDVNTKKVLMGLFGIFVTYGLCWVVLRGEINVFLITALEIFPLFNFIANILINYYDIVNIINIVAYLGINIIVFMVTIYIFKKIYINTLMDYLGGYTRDCRNLRQISTKNLKEKSKFISLIKKEFIFLLRIPAYTLTYILPTVTYPILLLVLMVKSLDLNILSFIKHEYLSNYIILFGFCFSLIQSGSNNIAATSISRDGNELFLLKTFPVSYKLIINAKLITSILIGLISIFFTSIALVHFKISVVVIIKFILISLLGIIFSSQLGLIFDIFNPKMHWENTHQAIRQNINIFFNMAICIILSVSIIYIFFNYKINIINYTKILVAIFSILNIIMYKAIIFHLNTNFEKIC